MMKKKSGFTLIELLAVIVVLAVIALIATPTILGVIENSKKGAFKDSIYGIMDAAEFYIATNVGMENGTFICNGEKCFNESNDKIKLNFKGEVPISGNVIIEKNKISVSQLSNGKYCANGTRENLIISSDCNSTNQSAPVIILSESRSTKDAIQFIVSFSDNYSLAFETETCTYGVNSNEEKECRAQGGSGGGNTGESEYYIDGLVSGTTYNFKVCIENEAGNKSCETFSLTPLDPAPKFTLQDILHNFGTSQQGKYYKQVVLVESMVTLPTIKTCTIIDAYDNEYSCSITSTEATPITSGYKYALQVTFGNDERDLDLDYYSYFDALLDIDINGSSYTYEYEYDA